MTFNGMKSFKNTSDYYHYFSSSNNDNESYPNRPVIGLKRHTLISVFILKI